MKRSYVISVCHRQRDRLQHQASKDETADLGLDRDTHIESPLSHSSESGVQDACGVQPRDVAALAVFLYGLVHAARVSGPVRAALSLLLSAYGGERSVAHPARHGPKRCVAAFGTPAVLVAWSEAMLVAPPDRCPTLRGRRQDGLEMGGAQVDRFEPLIRGGWPKIAPHAPNLAAEVASAGRSERWVLCGHICLRWSGLVVDTVLEGPPWS